jgi:hypothetical protein
LGSPRCLYKHLWYSQATFAIRIFVSRISYLVSRTSYLVSRISYLVSRISSSYLVLGDCAPIEYEVRGGGTSTRGPFKLVRRSHGFRATSGQSRRNSRKRHPFANSPAPPFVMSEMVVDNRGSVARLRRIPCHQTAPAASLIFTGRAGLRLTTGRRLRASLRW